MSSDIAPCRACGKKNRVPGAAAGFPICGACGGPVAWSTSAGDSDWTEVVERSPLPVLVDFWAEWCGPCRQVSPLLEKLASEMAGRLKLVKVDVDAAPGLARRFEVRGIPTLVIADHGEVLARQTGAAGEAHLRQWVEQALAGVPGS